MKSRKELAEWIRGQSDDFICEIATRVMEKPAPFSRLYAIAPKVSDEIKFIRLVSATKEKRPLLPEAKFGYSYSFRALPPAIGFSDHNALPSDWLPDYSQRILANGFYFSYSNRDLPRCAGSITDVRNGYSQIIVEELDPSTAIILCDDKQSLQYGCVSKDKQKIYQYSLKYLHTTFRQLRDHHPHRDMPSNPAEWDKIAYTELKFEDELEKFTYYHKGDCIYTLDKENTSICSIAAFPESKEKCMAVALDTGEIKLGHIKEKKFVETAQLVKPSEVKSEQPSKEEIELLSSKNVYLIVHHINKKMLNIWDINQQKLLFEAKDLQVNKLNITIDGQYLTALGGAEGTATKTVFIYNLASSENHVLNLDEPVTDFLINSDNSICMMTEKGLKRLEGTAEKYLETYYQKLIEKDPHQAKALVRSHPKLSIFAPKEDRGDSKSQDNSSCLVM